MHGMFSGCRCLKTLNISGWDISSVINMSYMFEGCYCLKTLNISGWDTSSVINMGSMFYNCKKSIIPDWYKKRLTESKLNFNSVDYSDEERDLINNQTVLNLTSKYHPKTKEGL